MDDSGAMSVQDQAVDGGRAAHAAALERRVTALE